MGVAPASAATFDSQHLTVQENCEKTGLWKDWAQASKPSELRSSKSAGASKLAGKDGSESEMLEAFIAEIPLARAQATWDIGITAVFLASEAARCVNGDTIVSQLVLTAVFHSLSRQLIFQSSTL